MGFGEYGILRLSLKRVGDFQDSLTLSSVETADQIVTLLNEGMFGSWLTSSKIEIELAALIPMAVLESVSVLIASLTIFLIFLGVILLSTTC